MGNGARPVRLIGVLAFCLLALAGGAAYWLARAPGPGPSRLDPNPVRQGSQVRVSVTGFLPLEPLSMVVSEKQSGGPSLSLGVVPASTDGGLDQVYVALPDDLASGSHQVTIEGQVSGRQSTAVVYVRAKTPWATLASGESKPRAELGLVAGGFQPGETVSVLFSPPQGAKPSRPATTHRLANLPTDRVGNTTWTLVRLPLVKPGAYSLLVKGNSSGAELRKDLTLSAYQPSVELSPWAGPPGIKVKLNAKGFEPGEKVGVYLGAATASAAKLVADRDGDLWGAGPVTIPYVSGLAPLTIDLVGEDSTARTSAQFRVLAPKPWLELTQYWGAPGGSVEFSGGGWAGGERIAFHVGSVKSPPVAYGQADDYGWLHNAGPATIPKAATYQVTFVAEGESSHSIATATFKIVLPFGISPVGVTPTAGGAS
ncbi:MAG: hypothetical protein ACRDIY_01075 [Chloroflexota bacterium]